MDLINLLQTEYGLDTSRRGKFIKHADNKHDLRKLWISGKLELYQSFQTNDVFNCDYIISLIGEGSDKARFLGVYSVDGKQDAKKCKISIEDRRNVFSENAKIYYKLTKVHGFSDVEGRVIIKWGGSQQWHHYVHRNKKEIWQILPKGFYKEFPGIENIEISYLELNWIIENGSANIDWYYGLSGCKGVYLVLDTLTGQQYIGSATGKGGIWQRWTDYIKTYGHGNNASLKKLIDIDPKYSNNFRFSVLKFFPKETDRNTVLDTEKFLKRCMGTRVFGLNEN